MSLLVRTTHQTEVLLEQKVTLQTLELSGDRTLPVARDLPDGHLRVVVADPNRNTANELKGPTVAFLERLRAFAGERLNEHRVRVRQRHHEQRHLHGLAVEYHVSEPVVHLSVARWMRKRQKDLAILLPPGTHRLLHDRDATRVAVLVTQPLENPLSRVTLLAMHLPVTVEHLVNERQKRFQLRGTLLRQPVTWRLAVRQDLLQRVPVNVVLDTRLPLAQLATRNTTANLNPQLHVTEHSCPPQSVRSEFSGNPETLLKQLRVIT